MPKCVALKGGWFWKGDVVEQGQIIEESAEWIANRAKDVGSNHPNGLVRLVGDGSEPEAATIEAPETAEAPRVRGKR